MKNRKKIKNKRFNKFIRFVAILPRFIPSRYEIRDVILIINKPATIRQYHT